MSSFTIQEAQDLSAFAAQTSTRLTQARLQLEQAAPTVEARAWLEFAAQRVQATQSRLQSALADAGPLPEFANARKVRAETLSAAWADAVERVFDGVVANVSANGPLIEALFPHQRFAALRRSGTAAHSFWLEFERRAESTYVRRLCNDPEYGFLAPLLEAAKESERALREAASPRPLPEARALELREAVSAAAAELELALRQARALSEAAFVETPNLVSELGLDAKPKRRAVRTEAQAEQAASNRRSKSTSTSDS